MKVINITVRERQQPRWYVPKGQLRGYFNPSYREYSRNPRCYFSPSGETILENLSARWQRPHRAFREYLDDVRKAIVEQLGPNMNSPKERVALEAQVARMKFSWSQRAGCSCGCSPGFVVQDAPDALRFADVYVTVGGES